MKRSGCEGFLVKVKRCGPAAEGFIILVISVVKRYGFAGIGTIKFATPLQFLLKVLRVYSSVSIRREMYTGFFFLPIVFIFQSDF